MKNTLLVGGLVGLVALGVGFLVGNPIVNVQVPSEKSEAVGGPAFNTSYLVVGGEQLWAKRSTALPVASTTLCAIAAPSSASSTLIKAGLRIDTATGTAATMTIHKSASPWLKTTLIAQDLLAASNVGALLATSTANDTIFQSGDYLVFGLSQTYTSVTPSGACFAVWAQL